MSDSSSDAEMQQPQRPDNSSSKREKVDEVADDQSSNDSDNGRGSSDSGSSDSNDDEEENEDGNGSHSEEEEQEEHEEHEGEDAGEGRDSIVGGQPQPEHPETRKKQGAKKVKISASEAAKRGVVYISRPPPYMRPDKVRHLLQQYAEVTRIYLAPEDETVRRRRRKQGGNRKMRYTEGWVEFADRKQAKRIVALLNGTMLGGKKRFYREDLWTLKYLSKFKWTHLNEKMAYERIVREKKLKASLSQAKKESDFVRKKVGQARKLEYARAKGITTSTSGGGKVMNFKQRPVAGSTTDSDAPASAAKKRSHTDSAKKQGKPKRTRTRFFNDDSE